MSRDGHSNANKYEDQSHCDARKDAEMVEVWHSESEEGHDGCADGNPLGQLYVLVH